MNARSALTVLALLSLAGCESEAINLGLRVYPDGSGEVEFAAILPDAAPSEDPKRAELLEVLDVRSEVGLRVLLLRADFPGPGLKLGGLELGHRQEDDAHHARLRIATTADAPWYRALVMGPKELAALERLSLAQRRLAEVPPLEDLLVLISLRMPGAITSSTLEGPAWQVTIGERSESDRTFLKIPVRDILAGARAEVTWTVRSGATTPDTEADWADAVHRRAQVPAEDRACEERLLAAHFALKAKRAHGDEPENGPALLRLLEPELARCPTGQAYRVAKRPGRTDVQLCDDPGNHPDGIHVLTRDGDVVWRPEGSPLHAQALEETESAPKPPEESREPSTRAESESK